MVASYEFSGLFQKHGGKIVADIADATYVVLYLRQDYSWEYLKEAMALDKIAVQPFFIYDCVDKNELLDGTMKMYSFRDTTLRDARGRSVPVDLAELRRIIEAEKRRMEKMPARRSTPTEDTDDAADDASDGEDVQEEEAEDEEGQEDAEDYLEETEENEPVEDAEEDDEDEEEVDRGLLDEDETQNGAQAESSSSTAANTNPSGSRLSPSPPPPTHPVQWVTGRNRYTEEEMTYAKAHVTRVFKRNPNFPHGHLGTELHRKVGSNGLLPSMCLIPYFPQMPQHTVKSWMSKVYAPEFNLDNLRRKARFSATNSLMTSSDVAQPNGLESSGATERVPPSSDPQAVPPQSVPAAAFESAAAQEERLAHDLEFLISRLVDFLLRLDEQPDLPDDEVWRTMSATVSIAALKCFLCLTQYSLVRVPVPGGPFGHSIMRRYNQK